MLVSEKQLAAFLINLSEGVSSEDLPNLVTQYLEFLRRKKKLRRLGRIFSSVESQILEAEKRIPVVVQTATPASPSLKTTVEEAIPHLFFAEHYDISYTTNPGIIGGAILSSPEVQWDGSVKKRISHLSRHLGIPETTR